MHRQTMLRYTGTTLRAECTQGCCVFAGLHLVQGISETDAYM